MPIHDAMPPTSDARRHAAPDGNGERPRAAAIDRAAVAPMHEPVSAAENTLPAPDRLSAADAGRRTLTTAFVRVGPGGYLTVALHGGEMIVLRDVTMGPGKYCGIRTSGARYCGDYGQVASARPGGGPSSG